jgi:hypothetical protein
MPSTGIGSGRFRAYDPRVLVTNAAMSRRRALTALCGLVVGLSLALPAAEAAAPSATYTAYAACGLGPQAPPASKCTKGSKVGAFFKSSEQVQYKLCAKFPNGQRLCAAAQNAPAGKLKVNKVTTDLLGRHKLVWHLPDRKIVRYFRLTAD